MAVLTRDPTLFEPLRTFDQVFGRVLVGGMQTTGFVPSLDVRELDDEYVVLVDLPGVRSEDVNVELSDQRLTISGTRVPYEQRQVQQLERPFGAFSRTLTLAAGIESESISAEYADGVLTLHIKKPEQAKPKKIAISGGSNRKQIGK
jgi:HSP20 family protein